MGPGIVVPVAVLMIVGPTALYFARRRFKEVAAGDGGDLDRHRGIDPSVRLTSNALRGLSSPTWRVVHEIAPDRLAGVDHVVVGPAGVFAVTTSMDALPSGESAASPDELTAAAVARGEVDDALRRCAMAVDRLVVVHWGVNPAGSPTSRDIAPGVTAVDGRGLLSWAETFHPKRLTPAQVDLAWQTIVTAIGRPDPLS